MARLHNHGHKIADFKKEGHVTYRLMSDGVWLKSYGVGWKLAKFKTSTSLTRGRSDGHQEIEVRAQLLTELAKEVSTEDLRRVVRGFPYLISEAVRELNGEVEYLQLTKHEDERKKS